VRSIARTKFFFAAGKTFSSEKGKKKASTTEIKRKYARHRHGQKSAAGGGGGRGEDVKKRVEFAPDGGGSYSFRKGQTARRKFALGQGGGFC